MQHWLKTNSGVQFCLCIHRIDITKKALIQQFHFCSIQATKIARWKTAPGICQITVRWSIQHWNHLWWNICSKKGATDSGVLQKVPRKPKGGPHTKVQSFLWLLGSPWMPGTTVTENSRRPLCTWSINDVTSDPTTVAGLLILLKSYDRNKHSSDQQIS